LAIDNVADIVKQRCGDEWRFRTLSFCKACRLECMLQLGNLLAPVAAFAVLVKESHNIEGDWMWH
jgi:hypothetical protein